MIGFCLPFHNILDEQRHGAVKIHLVFFLEIEEQFSIKVRVLQCLHNGFRQAAVFLEKFLNEYERRIQTIHILLMYIISPCIIISFVLGLYSTARHRLVHIKKK